MDRYRSPTARREFPFWTLYAAAVLLLAAPFIPYLTDDTFIYLQFARNLAAGHGFSFNPGEPTYGFTSPLWTILLAAAARCGSDPLAAAKVLGAVFLAASVPAFAFASRQIIPSRRGRLAALAAWTANAWMIRWSLSGMETAMAVFLVLIAIAAWMDHRVRDRLPFLPGALIGLAALTRPECLGLAALAALDVLLHSGRRRVQAMTALAAGFGAITVPWALHAHAQFGAILPNTVYAKGGSWSLGIADLHWATGRVAAIIAATSLIEISIILAGSMMAIRALSIPKIRDWLRIRFLPAAWTLSLPALYALRGESALVSRYLIPAICWIVIFGFAAVDARALPEWYRILRDRPADTKRRTTGGRSGGASGISTISTGHATAHSALSSGSGDHYPSTILVWVLAALIVSQNAFMLYGVNYPSAMQITRGLRGPLMEVAWWIRDNTPTDATIGLLDIGVTGYYSDRRVIDLHGHLDRGMLEARGTMRIEEFVETLAFASVARPDYLVDSSVDPQRLSRQDRHPDVCEPVIVRRFGERGIARRDVFHYTLYRMRWDLYNGDPPRSGP